MTTDAIPIVTIGIQGPQGPQGEMGEGVKAGGTTGQVLRKASDADFDTEWYTATGTGTVTSVTYTGDGVVYVATPTSPITTSGTLQPSLITQAANTFLSGPATGSNATPSFRGIVSADLPIATTSTIGGVQAVAQVSHNWIQYIDNSGVPHLAQPAYADISGLGSAATQSSSAFATAAQGTKADSALQSSDIGVSIQAYSSNLTSWSGKIAPSSTVVGTDDTQTLTNKSIVATQLTGTLQAAQFPALTGDITTSAGSVATTLKNTGTAGTYTKVTTDAQGRISSGSNPTTLAGYGITDAATSAQGAKADSALQPSDIGTSVQAYNSNLTIWAGKTAPSGAVVGTTDSQTLTNKTISGASNTLSNIANSALTNSSITINGTSIALGGSQTITAAVPNALTISTGLALNSGTTFDGSAARTLTIDSSVVTLNGAQTLTNKSIVATQLTGTLQAGQFPALTGDISTSAGSLTTAIGANKVTNTMLAGSIAASKLIGTDIATVGTVTAGTWNATTIAQSHGGTGFTSYTDGQILIGNSADGSLSRATLTQGDNITITNGNGSITISATSGGGTVSSVTFTGDGTVLSSTPSSAVTTSGTVQATLNMQSANLVLAGPTTGSAAAPTFRSLVGADLPNPSASSLGGVQSIAGQSHKWINSISTSGIPSLSQPSASDISGLGTAATENLGTVIIDDGSGNLTIGSAVVANAMLQNNSVTFNGSTVALGSSATITANTTNALTIGTGLALNSGTTFNGSAAVTLGIDSTVATLTGSQTLTNKTLTTPVLNGTITGTGVSTASSASTLIQRDANQNMFANNLLGNATATTSAAGTTILTAASSKYQSLTGSSTQTYQLPDATTLSLGPWFTFNNNSSGSLTITNAGGTTLYTVPAGGIVQCGPTNISSANGAWDFHGYYPGTVTWGSGTTGLVMNTALNTTPSISAGASSSTSPSFIPQRGSSTTGYGGDSTHLYGIISGTASFTSTSTTFNIPSGAVYQINGTQLAASNLSNGTTGSGNIVLATSPTLVTPTLGVASATSINKVAITAPASSATLTLADGSTLATSGANSLTLTTSGSTNVTLPTSGTLTTLATVIATANSWSKAQTSTPVSVTSSSNHIATDASLSNVFTHTMTENTTLDNPTNLVAGTYYTWIFTQASSAKTLAFGNKFKWPGGSGNAMVISTGSGAIDVLTTYYDGTNLLSVVAQNY